MIPERRTRILLVDDHPIVRQGLRILEAQDPALEVVAEADSVEAAWTAVQTAQPDLVILDIRLRNEDGLDVCRRCKRQYPDIRVLCLTSYADDRWVLQAMEAGADGYLLKDRGTEPIQAAIHSILAGQTVFDPVGDPAREQNDPLGTLSPAELRVLAEVARGMTDKEVAAVLKLSEKTVRNHLSKIFEKLDADTRTRASLIFIQNGGFSRL
jgi:DNA-binding NarL/FixJ family response regulator